VVHPDHIERDLGLVHPVVEGAFRGVDEQHPPVGRERFAEHQAAHQFGLVAHGFGVDFDTIGESNLREIEFVGDVGRTATGGGEGRGRHDQGCRPA
jgi:hypothetical protein